MLIYKLNIIIIIAVIEQESPALNSPKPENFLNIFKFHFLFHIKYSQSPLQGPIDTYCLGK
jgi:hypothetical protein